MLVRREKWKEIEGYDGLYLVSDMGRFKSLKKWRGKIVGIREPYTSPQGYPLHALYKDGVTFSATLSRLVLEAFVGPAPVDKPYACHEDGNPMNCVLSNLRWDSNSGNQMDRVKHGTSNRGSRNGRSKLSEDDVRAIKVRIAAGESNVNIHRDYPHLDGSAISAIRIGRNWSHL